MKALLLPSGVGFLIAACLLHLSGAARAEDARPSLQIKSISPAPPAELKAGEHLTIAVEYQNPQARPVQIFARPYTKGQSAGGYRAHGSPAYRSTSGNMEGYFYFDQPTTIDEVRVVMVDPSSTDHQPIATASQPIKVTWTGTRIPPTAKSTPATKSAPATATGPRTEGPAAGQPVDIKFTAIDGREVDLAKLRGKVVLIDFWATWCGPCVGEIPHVVEAYQKFHEKGFEIVGISFDQDKKALERMLEQKGMTWPQYFDGKGWQNQFGQRFGIPGIPTMWLIDRNGLIATTNARNDLAGQVEALLTGQGASAKPSASRAASGDR